MPAAQGSKLCTSCRFSSYTAGRVQESTIPGSKKSTAIFRWKSSMIYFNSQLNIEQLHLIIVELSFEGWRAVTSLTFVDNHIRINLDDHANPKL